MPGCHFDGGFWHSDAFISVMDDDEYTTNAMRMHLILWAYHYSLSSQSLTAISSAQFFITFSWSCDIVVFWCFGRFECTDAVKRLDFYFIHVVDFQRECETTVFGRKWGKLRVWLLIDWSVWRQWHRCQATSRTQFDRHSPIICQYISLVFWSVVADYRMRNTQLCRWS